jgi:hypothetical protein
LDGGLGAGLGEALGAGLDEAAGVGLDEALGAGLDEVLGAGIDVAPAAGDISGYADVFLDKGNEHASIAVTRNGTTIHSEQVGTTGQAAAGSYFQGSLSSNTHPIRIPLPNAARAQAFQKATEGYVFGAYDLQTRSCVTYCLDVLRAGGVEDVPDPSVGWRRSTLWIWSKDN